MSETTNRRPGPHQTRIDEAIDRAVRDIMHREPPPGLRRRVLARLEEPEPRRFVPRLAFALAAAIVVIGATMTVMRTTSAPQPAPAAAPATVAAESPRVPPPQAAPPPAIASPLASVPIRRQAAATRPRRPQPVTDAAELTRIFGPRQGRVAAAGLPDDLRVPSAPTTTALVEPPGGLAALPPIEIPPLRIDPIPVPPPITIK